MIETVSTHRIMITERFIMGRVFIYAMVQFSSKIVIKYGALLVL